MALCNDSHRFQLAVHFICQRGVVDGYDVTFYDFSHLLYHHRNSYTGQIFC